MNPASFFSKPLPAETEALFPLLEELGQEHLFADWEGPGIREKEKHGMLAALKKIDASYPGGLRGYVLNARKLLADSREGRNPYEGLVPQKPDAVDLSAFGEAFDRFEAQGLEAAKGLVVVLVAGGLGERLGYPGIKIDIPVEVTRGTTYLGLYAAWIKAVEARSGRQVPFVIMTSRDTHEATQKSLKSNGYFGLEAGQVHVLMQELVPAILDNDGRLAKENPYELILKPHGHGDVHMLLHASGLAERFLAGGKSHLAFIQDTNGQVVNVLLPALGVSVARGFHFNSLAVGRIPGEAVGALTRLVGNGRDFTINVEYNQLDPLLRATVSPSGDVPGPDGLSLFPGNINVLLVELASYASILESTRGIIAEFVNPKYADASRTSFKKPTRLETMMQDLPKLFGPRQKTGVTVFERRYSFSADKNKLEDARAKLAQKGPPESGASAECDFYHGMRVKAARGGMEIPQSGATTFAGIPVDHAARVVFDPSFILTLEEARRKIRGGSLAADATLAVKGQGVTLTNVTLTDKAGLVIECDPRATLQVKDLVLGGVGFEQIALDEKELADPKVPPYLKIRAYRIEERKPLFIRIRKPGAWTLGADGKLVEVGNSAGSAGKKSAASLKRQATPGSKKIKTANKTMAKGKSSVARPKPAAKGKPKKAISRARKKSGKNAVKKKKGR